MSELPALVCSDCDERYDVRSLAWRCTCGGVLDVDSGSMTLAMTPAQATRTTMWRYESVSPVPFDERISLGEGMSPIVASRTMPEVGFKLDFLMPTLSFKDRGAVVLASLAAQIGVRSAVVDSSGNAGTAAAAYLGRAGVTCRVLVPPSTSPGKLAQIRAHGAEVVLVPGDRADTASAAMSMASTPGTFYASHVFHPYFLHGVKTYGYEIWEQCGRTLPSTVVVPVGNGTLVLGCYLAFRELVAAGLAARIPALLAVQTEGCAPVEAAFAARSETVAPVTAQPTVAEGIAIAAPPRGRQILAAIRESGGAVVSVSDDDVLAARRELAAEGLYVEPTSAVCWAAIRVVGRPPEAQRWNWALARNLLSARDVILPLCGAGLKVLG